MSQSGKLVRAALVVLFAGGGLGELAGSAQLSVLSLLVAVGMFFYAVGLQGKS